MDALTAEYVKRAAHYCAVEASACPTEEALLKGLERPGRTAPILVAMDSRGKQVSSEELAALVRPHLERGTQELIFAIGPADGGTAAPPASAPSAVATDPVSVYQAKTSVLVECVTT